MTQSTCTHFPISSGGIKVCMDCGAPLNDKARKLAEMAARPVQKRGQ